MMKKIYPILITVLVGLGVLFAIAGFTIRSGQESVGERANQECLTEERVFDEADILTDEQENVLREQIAQKEAETGEDIVLLLINDPDHTSEEAMRDYAQNFYEENGFGWDKPNGDGIIYADNWAEDYQGYKYCWLCTTGKAVEALDSGDIDDVIDLTNETVNDDPYGAYQTMIDAAADRMAPAKTTDFFGGILIALLAAAILTVIFLILQLLGNKGKMTTDRSTYVQKDSVHMNQKTDRFLRSHVTRVKIEHDTDSGSGGGTGGHGGGGGHH